MAFADILRSAIHTTSEIAALIEKLLIPIAQESVSGTISTNSTTQVDIADMDVTIVVAAGEKVEIEGMIITSHGTANSNINLYIYRDATAVESVSFKSYRSSTGGDDSQMVIKWIDTPGAGTYTYKLRWSVNSGTAYSTKQRMDVKQIQSS